MDINENIEIEFIESVRKKNAGDCAYRKYLLGFSVVFVVSLIIGFLVSLSTQSVVSDELRAQMSGHFTDVFKGCSLPADYFTVIISSSSADLRYLLLIFTSGFTFFCKYATGAMIAFRAFSIGFSSEFLFISLKDGIIGLEHPALSLAVFLASEILIAMLLIYLSVKSTLFGYDFRRLRGRKSLIIRSPVIYRYVFLFLTAIGFVISVNAIYCALSSLI